MELLYPGKTCPLQDAKIGNLIAFINGGKSHYGVVCRADVPDVVHQSVIELAPERCRRSEIADGSSVFELETACIELLPHEMHSGDVPADGAKFLGLDNNILLVPYQDTHGNFRIADIRSGIMLNDWRSRTTLWFSHWRIVVPAIDGNCILYDSLNAGGD
jgi:hypothetical protein